MSYPNSVTAITLFPGLRFHGSKLAGVSVQYTASIFKVNVTLTPVWQLIKIPSCINVFLDVIMRSVAGRYRRFGGTYCLNIMKYGGRFY
jgi:hypothetical protein